MPKKVLLGRISELPELFNIATYTGTGNAQNVNTTFAADLVIVQNIGPTGSAAFFIDTVRGGSLSLRSDLPSQESSGTTSITSTYFRTGTSTALNYISQPYVVWYFKAGGTAVTNTDGAITSTVSANPSAGFSVITYTGNDSTGTIGHGLNSTPELVIVKNRNFSSGSPWYVGAPLLGTSGYLWLDDNIGTATYSDGSGGSFFNYSGWSNSVVNVYDAGSTAVNSSSYNYVMYAFHSVAGVSKIGTYTGNGSTTGPTITTGFRPRFILFKRTNSTSNWLVLDSVRSPTNPANDALFLDLDIDELESTTYNVDFNSDGFSVKATSGNINANGSTYLYVAFA